MRTTLNLDDELMKKAMKFSRIKSKTQLVNHALQELITSIAYRELANMHGAGKGMALKPARRRRSEF